MFGLRYVSKGMAAALILSIIIAFMISLVPNLYLHKLDKEFPVFKQQNKVSLTDYNIVDFVASFPVEMQIKKVMWKNETLSIDFLINRDNKIDTNIIYKDMYTVIKKSLVNSSNVKEVLLRVFIHDNTKLFVAVSANKKDISNNIAMDLDPQMVYKDFLMKYFGLNYGNAIKGD